MPNQRYHPNAEIILAVAAGIVLGAVIGAAAGGGCSGPLDAAAKVATAALTPLIGAVVAYVAYRQARTGELRLKAELYDRRLKVYLSVINFIEEAVRHGKLANEDFGRLSAGSAEAYFLFGKEVTDYIQSVREKGADLLRASEEIGSQNPEHQARRTAISAEWAELATWFGHQFEHSRQVFAKHLSL